MQIVLKRSVRRLVQLHTNGYKNWVLHTLLKIRSGNNLNEQKPVTTSFKNNRIVCLDEFKFLSRRFSEKIRKSSFETLKGYSHYNRKSIKP